MIIRSAILTSLLMLAAPLRGETLDDNLRSLLTQEQISAKVKETARQISRDYQDKDLVIVMVMKGALCLAADLIRELDLPLDLQYVQCSSYGAAGSKRGELQVIGLDRLKIEHRDVLIVDDIFDSGNTLAKLTEALLTKHPRTLRSMVLLEKEIPHVTDIRPDYTLFKIDDLFVVGYGLDFKERYRGLTGVFVYEETR